MAYLERKAHPSANHLITERYQAERYAAHTRALSAAKPRIDNRAPPTYAHLTRRGKKAAMEEGECSPAA